MIITMSGEAGAGKSTITKLLSQRLGYQHISVGDMRRAVATKMGLDINEFNAIGILPGNEEKFDGEFDTFQQTLDIHQNIVLDSRMGFHWVPQAIKIFLTIDKSIAAERIFKDRNDGDNYNDIIKNQEMLEHRNTIDKEKLIRLYGVNPRNLNNYDLVIDTSNKSIEQVYNEIIGFIESKTPNFLAPNA